MAKINVRDRNKNNPDRKPNWEYRFEAAKIEGKRKHISKSGFKTKREALEAGTKALAEYNNAGVHFEPSEISVSDYLDYWHKVYVKVNLRYNTQLAYINIIENHLKPYFGKFKLKSLSPGVIQEYVNYLNSKDISRSLTIGILSMLQASLDYAVFPLTYIKDNPMRYVKIKTQNRPPKEREVISKDNFDKILNMFPYGNRYHILVLLGWYCGLRISEACALTWDDIDLENKIVYINKQLIRRNIRTNLNFFNKLNDGQDNPKGWYFTAPKYNSMREVRISDYMAEALQREKDKQKNDIKKYQDFYTMHIAETEKDEKGNNITRIIPVQKAFMNKNYNILNFVCLDENGKLTTPETFTGTAKKIRTTLNIPFDYHSLRHTHATILVENGANIKTVQKRLGHKNVTTTLQKYVHDTEDLQEEAVNILNNFTFGIKNVHAAS